MKYVAPINGDQNNPNRSYVTGNPSTGVEGSQVAGPALEHAQREILAVITAAELTPTDTDLTQLLQAINLLIGGGGGGGGSGLVAHNPVYPEAETSDGHIGVAASGGQVTVSEGYSFIHRGSQRINTGDTILADRRFNTVANKTYHLRWRWNDGSPAFGLFDLANLDYNPTGEAETSTVFDSSYDDMMIARVTTNGSNAAAVDTLANRNSLRDTLTSAGDMTSGAGTDAAQRTTTLPIAWARRPTVALWPTAISVGPGSGNQFSASDGHDHDEALQITALSRYSATILMKRDFAHSFAVQAALTA